MNIVNDPPRFAQKNVNDENRALNHGLTIRTPRAQKEERPKDDSVMGAALREVALALSDEKKKPYFVTRTATILRFSTQGKNFVAKVFEQKAQTQVQKTVQKTQVQKTVQKTQVQKTQVQKTQVQKTNWIDEFKQEINALKNISRHRNICGMFGYRRLETFGVILFQDCGMDLFEVATRTGNLDEKELRHISMQLVSGLSFLHKHQIAHLDMKLENAALDCMGRVRIIDFGFSKKGKLFSGAKGTLGYLAPEQHFRRRIVQEGEDGSKISVPVYSLKADVYGLGVMLFCLATSSFPVENPGGILCSYKEYNQYVNNDTIFLKATKEAQWFYFWYGQVRINRCLAAIAGCNYILRRDEKRCIPSNSYFHMVSKMLLFDAQDRPSSAELNNHKWLGNDALPDKDCLVDLYARAAKEQ
jgi:serine/threonine protein kinase